MKNLEVPLADLVPDPFGLRVYYDPEKVDRLKASILQMGLLSPLKVWLHEGKQWIVDGNYRYRALKELGYEPVSIDSMSEETTYEQALLVAVVSNWHREEFYFMDKARSVRRLREGKLSDLEICTQLGLALDSKGYPGRHFHNYRSFEEYVSEEVKDVILQLVAEITARHAEALVSLKHYPDKQCELAELIVTKSLTGPQAVTWAKRWISLYAVPEIELPLSLGKYQVYCKSSASMDEVEDDSVHLVVTSPPYNADASYDVYVDRKPIDEYKADMIESFKECYKKLVRGGRVAVVIPMISKLDEEVTFIPLLFSEVLKETGFQIRDTIVWQKSETLTIPEGTAWGSWCSPTNPTMRSIAELILIGHKEDPRLEGEYVDILPNEFKAWKIQCLV